MNCYFCNRPIIGKAERHHIIPKRYFQRGSGHPPENLADAHHDCHVSWHKQYDDPRWKLKDYRRHVESLSYGLGVFA